MRLLLVISENLLQIRSNRKPQLILNLRCINMLKDMRELVKAHMSR